MIWTRPLTLIAFSFVIIALSQPAVRAASIARALLLESVPPAAPAPTAATAQCGTLDKPCCPSIPISSNGWHCTDGSTCVYFQLGDNSKISKCQAIDRKCGTGAFTPCCPMRYDRGIMYNPDLAPGNGGCPATMFCDTLGTKLVCVPKPKACGKFGQKCCVSTSRLGPYFECAGPDGAQGYCAKPPGYKGTEDPPLRDLECTKCPDKLDPNDWHMVSAQGARCT